MPSPHCRGGLHEETIADANCPSDEGGIGFPSDEDAECVGFLDIESPTLSLSLPRHRSSAPPLSDTGRVRFASDGDIKFAKRRGPGRMRRFTSEDDVDISDEDCRCRGFQQSSPGRITDSPSTSLRRLEQQHGATLGAAGLTSMSALPPVSPSTPFRTISRGKPPTSPDVASRSLSASAAPLSPAVTPSRQRRRRPRGEQQQLALQVLQSPRRTVASGGHSMDAQSFSRSTWSRMRTLALIVLAMLVIITDETPASKTLRILVRIISVSARLRRVQGGAKSLNPPAFGIDHGREIALFPPQRSAAQHLEIDVRASNNAYQLEKEKDTESDQPRATVSHSNNNAGESTLSSLEKGGDLHRDRRRARRPIVPFARDGGAAAMPVYRPNVPELVMDARTLHPKERVIHQGHDHLVRPTTARSSLGINSAQLKSFVLEDTGVTDIRLVHVTRPDDERTGGILLPFLAMLTCVAGFVSIAMLLFGLRFKRSSRSSRQVTRARLSSGQERDEAREGSIQAGVVAESSSQGGRKKSREW
eukprot:CAMPEP_0113553568 /NCGR_PEP_ID=MMETSP0015_2-20120614/15683_1 /TAXON_ID=2838 /ORGANISM="Odontella" /LENGTH=531 /DNA_ID=CAMNT_0000454647 /DNA_START=199 /DNA_END=1791 /DNA_ORIENTATION=- /assembly_acc=CAM_ASM_000160